MSLALANAAKSEAARTRQVHIESQQLGVSSISDLLKAATTEGGRPLRRLTLRQLLMNQDGWGRARTAHALSLLTSLLGPEPTSRLTVAWLIDARAGGRRVRALADVLTERTQPEIGFPYAPLPTGGGSE